MFALVIFLYSPSVPGVSNLPEIEECLTTTKECNSFQLYFFLFFLIKYLFGITNRWNRWSQCENKICQFLGTKQYIVKEFIFWPHEKFDFIGWQNITTISMMMIIFLNIFWNNIYECSLSCCFCWSCLSDISSWKMCSFTKLMNVYTLDNITCKFQLFKYITVQQKKPETKL